MFGLPTEVVVMAGSLVLGLLMIMIVIARMYRKVGPNEALIRYGMGGTEVYCGRGALIFPMVQTCRDLSLELMSFDVAPQQNLYTKQGVAVTVEAVAQIKVKSDKESILTAAEQFLSKEPNQREGLIRLVMEGHLRGIIGQLTVEQIVKEPEMVGDRMRSTCADDMSKMGLEVVSFTIKEVRDKNEYITNMGRPDVARISATRKLPPRKPSATLPSNALKRNAPRPSPKRWPTRNASPRKPLRLPSKPKRNATWTSKRPHSSRPPRKSRRKPIRPTKSRPTSSSSTPLPRP